MKKLPLSILQWLDETALLLITGLCAFFAPTGKWIAFVGFLVAADMITGILAAHKAKKQIESRKMTRSIGKFVGYGLAVLIAYYLQIIFFPELPAMQSVSALIATIELKSIDENYHTMFGHSFFKTLIDLVQKQRKIPKS